MSVDLYEKARERLDQRLNAAVNEYHLAREAEVIALRQILDLHKPDRRGECEGCRCEHGFPDSLTWPCSSAKAVLGALGLSASTEESRA